MRTRYLHVESVVLLFLAAATAVCGADSERLKRLVTDVSNAPATFYTSAAIEGMARHSGAPSQPLMPDAIQKANTGLRATIALGEMGSAAMPALDVLVERFPKAVHMSTLTETFSAGEGSLDDWVMTKMMGEKNKFMFQSPVLDYESISKCEKFLDITHETSQANQQYSGSRLVSATVTVNITYTFYAGACALTRITGRDFGTDQRQWASWWAQNRGAVSTVAPSASSASSTSTAAHTPQAASTMSSGDAKTAARTAQMGGTYRFQLTTGDSFEGVVEARTDTSLIVDIPSRGGVAFRIALVRTCELVSLPANKSAGTRGPEILTFDELTRRSPKGDKIEIQLKAGQVFTGTLVAIQKDELKLDVDGSVIPFNKDVVARITTIIEDKNNGSPKAEKKPAYTGPIDTVFVRNPKSDDYGRRMPDILQIGVIVEDYGNTVTIEKSDGTKETIDRSTIARIARHSTAATPDVDPIKRYAMPLTCPADMALLDRPPMPGTDKPFFKTCMDRYEYPNRKDAPPNRNMSLQQAAELCGKAGKRLCTPDEWEYGCAGPDGHLYPYGNSYDENRCNTGGAKRIMTSGSRPKCVSRAGLYDMSGNVYEWVADTKGTPYMMGGPVSKCQARSPGLDGSAKPLAGFRCCKSN